MIFVGVAVAVVIALALLVSMDIGMPLGLSQSETAQLVLLGGFLIMLLSSLFSRRLPLSGIMRGALAWVAIFAVVIAGYAFRHELLGVADRVVGVVIPSSGIVSENGRVVTFQRGIGRSFNIDTRVNDAPVRMLFDTGASAVVLSYDDARRAGINVDQLRFHVPVQTANGQGRAASVRLEQINVGGIIRHGVLAFIAEPGMLDISLLGMSFLETLEGYSVSQNALELRG